jgi:hypothetical protein
LSETKYEKYFITDKKESIVYPDYEPIYKPGDFLNVLTLDDDVVKETSLFLDTNWFFPNDHLTGAGDGKGTGQVKPHVHTYDEVLCIFGSNPDDPLNLNGECEFWIGDEKHVITKSCILFIPKGTKHGPIGFSKIDRPVFQFGFRAEKGE